MRRARALADDGAAERHGPPWCAATSPAIPEGVGQIAAVYELNLTLDLPGRPDVENDDFGSARAERRSSRR